MIAPSLLQPKEEEGIVEEGGDDDDDDDDKNNSRSDPSAPWEVSCTLSSQNIKRNGILRRVAMSTPWIDCYELEQVGQSLITATLDLPLKMKSNSRKRPRRRRHHGEENHHCHQEDETSPLMLFHQSLNRLHAWKVRMGDRTPHAVESTYQLALCLWKDSNASGSDTTAEGLRLSYSSAIIRSINGLADAIQQQRAKAQSVALLCAELGIPTWLVDIRHEATHNQMPSLSVLRLATTTLLEYFYQTYWQPIFPSASSASPVMDTTSLLLQHLSAYQERQTKTKSNNQSTKRKKNSNNGSSPKKKKKKEKAANKVVVSVNNNNQSGDDGDVESDEEMYLNGSNIHFWGSSSSLGTNHNRFAALMMDTTKKGKKEEEKKEKESKSQQSTSRSRPTPRRSRAKKSKELSAHHHAKQFVKTGLNHLEGAYRVALLFLVWGGIGDIPSGQGALTPSCYIEFPQTEAGIRKLQQRHNILLTVVGTEWPGFLKSLLIHLVDCILSLEQQQQQHQQEQQQQQQQGESNDQPTTAPATLQRKLYFLESWVRHLLSGGFLGQVLPSVVPLPEMRSSKKPAPWQYLEKMWYPLNSLCDRLQSQLQQQASGDATTSKRLVDLFTEILGPNRVANFGLPEDDNFCCAREPKLRKDGQDNAVGYSGDGDCDSAVASSTNALSLQDIESMLFTGSAATGNEVETTGATPTVASAIKKSNEEDIGKHESESPQTDSGQAGDQGASQGNTTRAAWIRCTNWEPSAIGALPGCP